MNKRFKRLMSLLLTAVFVVSTMFSAFAETEVFEAADAEEVVAVEAAEAAEPEEAEAAAGSAEQMEYSDEEPETDPDQVVFHGFEGDPMLLGGVYDTDYPVVSDFRIEEDGQTVGQGEKIHISFKAEDKDGINTKSIYAYLKPDTAGNSWNIIWARDFTYNETTGRYEGEAIVGEYSNTKPGKYFTYQLNVADKYGYYTRYSNSSFRLIQKVLPGVIWYDNSKSKVTVTITDAGKEVKPGDKVAVKIEFAEKPELDYAYLNFDGTKELGMNYSSQWSGDFVYDKETGVLSGEYEILDWHYNGEYYINFLNYKEKESTEYQYINFLAYEKKAFVITGAVVADITDVTVTEAGKTLSGEDVLHISFKYSDSNEPEMLSRGGIYFTQDGEDPKDSYYYCELQNISYEKTTGIVKGEVPVSELYIYTGTFYISRIGANGFNKTFAKTDSTTFTVASVETDNAQISELTCDGFGKTVHDEDTVNISAKVTPAKGEKIETVIVNLIPFVANQSTVSNSISNGKGSISVELIYNEATGRYEGSHTFGGNDVYDVYHLDEYARVNGRQVYLTDYDKYIAFTESGEKEIKRLDPVTSVKWTDDFKAEGVLPQDFQNRMAIKFYNGTTGERVYWMVHTLTRYEAGQSVSSDGLYWRDEELTDGDYYFTMQMLGDGVDYFDSELVKSEVRHYTRPEAQLAAPTTAGWEKDDKGQVFFKITRPSSGASSKTKVIYFYAATAGEEPKECDTSTSATYDKTGTARVMLYDDLVSRYGSGFYYVKAKSMTDNIEETRSSEFSGLSEGYNLTDDTEKTVEDLEKIDPAGKTQDQIADEVQKTSTEDLKKAMLANDKALEQIERLEQATGIKTIPEVKEEVKGLDTAGISVKGAALNKLSDATEDIKLEVGKPAKEHVLPAQYNTAVSVQFSMDLTNVKDTENLKVPVMIDMPVPSTINPNFFVILHYCLNGDVETINPFVYTGGDGKSYAQFVLTRFSDFVFAEEKETEKYAVTVTTDGHGTASASVSTAAEGQTVTLSYSPAAGYTFSGWQVISGGVTITGNQFTMPAEAVTVKATFKAQSSGNSGSYSGGTVVSKAVATYSKNWFIDAAGIWKIRNKAGEEVKNAWLCDDAVKANGENVWYLLGTDGAMITAGLVQDASGNYYSLETAHNGFFGSMRHQNGTYDGIYMEFSQKHDGTFGAITNQSAIDALKAKYGVTTIGFGNDKCVYTKSFE